MKQRIRSFIMESKGNISLLLLTLSVTLSTGLPFGCIAGGCLGTITLVGVDYAASLVGMRLGDTDRPGIVGIALGVLISSII